MIEANGLVKRYGSTTAVNDLIRALAAAHGIAPSEAPRPGLAGGAFMELTRDRVEYQAAGPAR
jgi:hypothetical protein